LPLAATLPPGCRSYNHIPRFPQFTDDFDNDEEAVEEDKEQLDQVPLSFRAQQVKHILQEMDHMDFLLPFSSLDLDGVEWGVLVLEYCILGVDGCGSRSSILSI
jgi:hypothetical protein